MSNSGQAARAEAVRAKRSGSGRQAKAGAPKAAAPTALGLGPPLAVSAESLTIRAKAGQAATGSIVVTAERDCELDAEVGGGEGFRLLTLAEGRSLKKGESASVTVEFSPRSKAESKGALMLGCTLRAADVEIRTTKTVPLSGFGKLKAVGAGEVKVEVPEGFDLGQDFTDREPKKRPPTTKNVPPPAKKKRRAKTELEKKGAKLDGMLKKGQSFEERRAVELEIASDSDVAMGKKLGKDVSGSAGGIAASLRTALIAIQSVRADGFAQAVTHLGTIGLKEAGDVQQLALGLADRALWSLTVFSPWLGVGKAAIEMMKALRVGIRVRQTLGFSEGMAKAATAPLGQIKVSSGDKIGGALVALQKGITASNDRICDLARDRVHVVLASVISELERSDGQSEQEYLAQVEAAARVATFGPALNESGSVDSESVRNGAFNALMKELLVQTSVVKGGKLSAVATSKRHAPTVTEAAKAVGAPANLGLRPHELEAGQIFRAAAELGCLPDLSPEELRTKLASEEGFLVGVSFDPNYAFKGGGGSRWMSLSRKGVAHARPNFERSEYMTGPDLTIKNIRIARGQREKAKLGDQLVAQITSVDFIAKGRPAQGPSYVAPKVPGEFSIRVQVK